MEIRLPKPVLEWVDASRGNMSRQSFIVSKLSELCGADFDVHGADKKRMVEAYKK